MMFLSILIQLTIFLLLSMVMALLLSGGLYLFSKRKRKCKAIFGLISPFVFVFSFYFICLIGGFICASVFKTGCGMDGFWHTELPNGYVMESIENDFDREYLTSNIAKDEKRVVKWVTKIKISGDTIYGEQYEVNESPGNEHYFVLDTRTDELTQYKSLNEVRNLNLAMVASLTPIESFYYHSWMWVVPLGISAFIISSGLVLLLWVVILKLNPVKRVS